MKKTFMIAALLVLLLLAGSCKEQEQIGNDEENTESMEDSEIIGSGDTQEQGEESETDKNKGAGKNEDDPKDDSEAQKDETVDPESVNADELGDVMVLMYHHIAEPEDTWVRTPDNFRQDLKNLYEQGFRPVSLEEYVKGEMKLEAGMKPVVLTFDDGRQNNFNMVQDDSGAWIVDPDSAVGILVDFHKEHPDFPLNATFFINGGIPFGQEEFVREKLEFIIEKGMDIGNHSYTHANFTDLSEDELQRELGRLTEMVREYLPDYEVNTLALPFGSRPRENALQTYLHRGEYNGVKYEHIAILEVGWQPYHSPYHQSFDPMRIQRVRASEMNVDGVGMYDWMHHFEAGSRRPYVSDGNSQTISFPESRMEQFDEDRKEGRRIIPY